MVTERQSTTMEEPRGERFILSLRELSGALGDLGTLLPLMLGTIAVVGLAPTPVLVGFAIFYIATAAYYRLPITRAAHEGGGGCAAHRPRHARGTGRQRCHDRGRVADSWRCGLDHAACAPCAAIDIGGPAARPRGGARRRTPRA